MLWMLLLAQGGAGALPPIEFYPGTNGPLMQGYVQWSRQAQAGKWNDARKVLDMLPDGTVTVEWDDQSVPAELKPTYAQARDRAMTAWTDAMPELNIKLVPKGGEIKVSFVADLPPNEDSPGPAGAVHFLGFAPGEPSVDSVVALARGVEKLAATESDVYNEVLHAVALHAGVMRVPVRSRAASRNEASTNARHFVTSYETSLVRSVLRLRTIAEQYQKAKQKPNLGLAEMVLEKKKVDLPKVVQGTQIPFDLGVSNQGTAPLQYFLIPDCSCVNLGPTSPVAPSATGIMKLGINTTDFPGKHSKQILVISNDPEQPMSVVMVDFEATARFRFLRANPGSTYYVPDDGLIDDLYLFVDPSMTWKLGEPMLAGLDGVVAMEPWEGMMADPELRETAMQRKGYRLKILTSPDLALGRFPMMVEIPTNDPEYPALRYNFYVQRGIAAVPENLFLGALSGGSAKGAVLLTRPGRPFTVTKVESMHPRIRARAVPLPNGNVNVEIEFMAGEPLKEALNAVVKVHTDDPGQPILEIGVSGRLK